MSERVDVRGFYLDREELYIIWKNILKGEPYLFFVDGKLELEVGKDGFVKYLYPSYSMTAYEVDEATRFCRTEIIRATSKAEGLEDMDAAQLLHDYLCLQYEYDECLECDNMYLFLKNRKGTCQGYTFTYTAMLRELGIECRYAASDSMMHIWNLVFIDGEWYHVDVTWDDYPEVWGGVEYSNFLLSDEAIRNTAHTDWQSEKDIKCGSDRFDNTEFISPLTRFVGTGDFNADGRVDLMDAVLLAMRQRDDLPQKSFFIDAADIDRDGKLTDADLKCLVKSIIG